MDADKDNAGKPGQTAIRTRHLPRFFRGIAFCFVAASVFGACSPGDSGFRPMDPDAALFWDRQSSENAELLGTIIEDFNAGREGLPLKADFVGGYSEIFQKVTTSIQARSLPAMAVAYQSMTAVYAESGAIIPLDPLLHDPEIGYSQEELDDFFPVVLETNVYPSLGGQTYSFPFCKSVLMLYFNKTVLAAAGIDEPPQTWDEFLIQCRQIKARTGNPAYAVHVDASTIDGMIFSMGGEVYADGATRFDSLESLRVFQIFETLAKEGLAFQVSPGSYDDRVAFAADKVAFMFRTSAHQPYVALFIPRERWGVARIPQADPANPRTVLFGPNISIFNTTPEQQRTAWEFAKYFASPEVCVRWALGTGYLPIRRSAAEHPKMKAHWEEWEYNREPFDCLPFAKAEPTVPGWQEVRGLVAKAQTAVLAGVKPAAEAVQELKASADRALQQH